MKQEKKNCYIACSKDKVNAGHCDCFNRVKNKPTAKCNQCSRDAVWETFTHGYLCNTCHDRIGGIE